MAIIGKCVSICAFFLSICSNYRFGFVNKNSINDSNWYTFIEKNEKIIWKFRKKKVNLPKFFHKYVL